MRKNKKNHNIGVYDSMKKRALVSVSDKAGIVEFCKRLAACDYEIISTGGTAKALKDAGLSVIGISDLTGFPECLDGRVKTLHPVVHAGLLAMRSNPEHMAQLEKLNINTIDIVAVNLYPFKATISKPGVSFEDALAEAQRLGYAESNPAADVDGLDACRKIAILASLVFGRHVYPSEVATEGIRSITLEDSRYAEAAGGVIKLIGRAVELENGKLAEHWDCTMRVDNMECKNPNGHF